MNDLAKNISAIEHQDDDSGARDNSLLHDKETDSQVVLFNA